MLPTLLDISATCKSRKSSGGALLSNLLLDDRSRDLCDAATVGMAGWMSQCVMSNRRTSACGHVVTTGADDNLSRCNQVRSMLLTVLSLRACASTVDAVSAASVGSAVLLSVLSLRCIGRRRPDASAAVWMSGALTVRGEEGVTTSTSLSTGPAAASSHTTQRCSGGLQRHTHTHTHTQTGPTRLEFRGRQQTGDSGPDFGHPLPMYSLGSAVEFDWLADGSVSSSQSRSWHWPEGSVRIS
ncbi:hypothetical protein L1887_55092 [Cichorium endivia]|nr:hypothetical protein L1887_55092 [Cichorium endivia]